NHVVEGGHEFFHLLSGFDELDANRQVLRQYLDFCRVHRLVGAEAGHGARGSRAGYPFVKQKRQNAVAQGAKVVLRVLVDENRDLPGRARLEHTDSSRGCRRRAHIAPCRTATYPCITLETTASIPVVVEANAFL